MRSRPGSIRQRSTSSSKKACSASPASARRELPAVNDKASVHVNERFAGRFHRVVTLTDDLDPNAVQARYRDGVLHVSIKRHEAAQPRKIDIQ
jgi:HSP20 family protein